MDQTGFRAQCLLQLYFCSDRGYYIPQIPKYCKNVEDITHNWCGPRWSFYELILYLVSETSDKSDSKLKRRKYLLKKRVIRKEKGE